jgi:hypothetical protein
MVFMICRAATAVERVTSASAPTIHQDLMPLFLFLLQQLIEAIDQLMHAVKYYN